MSISFIIIVFLSYFLCVPAWIFSKTPKKIILLDIMAVILSFAVIIVFALYEIFTDDDGAATIGVMLIFPVFSIGLIYVRSFFFLKISQNSKKIFSRISFLSISIVLPFLYTLLTHFRS